MIPLNFISTCDSVCGKILRSPEAYQKSKVKICGFCILSVLFKILSQICTLCVELFKNGPDSYFVSPYIWDVCFSEIFTYLGVAQIAIVHVSNRRTCETGPLRKRLDFFHQELPQKHYWDSHNRSVICSFTVWCLTKYYDFSRVPVI